MIDSIFEILNKRALPGVLILDAEYRILYYNREAAELLSSQHALAGWSPESSPPRIPETVLALCDRLRVHVDVGERPGPGERGSELLEEVPGGQVSLRASFIGGAEEPPQHILVLIERIIEKRGVDLERVGREFGFSRKEVEVLHHICLGLSNRKIAEKMFISEYTVKNHIKSIMRRMGVGSRCEILARVR